MADTYQTPSNLLAAMMLSDPPPRESSPEPQAQNAELAAISVAHDSDETDPEDYIVPSSRPSTPRTSPHKQSNAYMVHPTHIFQEHVAEILVAEPETAHPGHLAEASSGEPVQPTDINGPIPTETQSICDYLQHIHQRLDVMCSEIEGLRKDILLLPATFREREDAPSEGVLSEAMTSRFLDARAYNQTLTHLTDKLEPVPSLVHGGGAIPAFPETVGAFFDMNRKELESLAEWLGVSEPQTKMRLLRLLRVLVGLMEMGRYVLN